MTKKRFYQLLTGGNVSSLSQHPGSFRIHDVWDKGGLNVTKVLLLLVFKNDDVLCVDRRFTANLMGGVDEANKTLKRLQQRYQCWYNEWLKKKAEAMKLYTIGYEKRSQDEMFNILNEAGVKMLVDTRDNPHSRKPGFSSNALAIACGSEKILYGWMPYFGIPKKIRDTAKTIDQDDTDAFWSFWIEYINKLSKLGQEIKTLTLYIEARPVCLLCYEREPECCHRKVLAEYLEGMIPELEVVHL